MQNRLPAPPEEGMKAICLSRGIMGMAIKFAGICGKEVRIIGTNRQTVERSPTTH